MVPGYYEIQHMVPLLQFPTVSQGGVSYKSVRVMRDGLESVFQLLAPVLAVFSFGASTLGRYVVAMEDR